MLRAGRKEKPVNARLKNRVRGLDLKRTIAIQILDKSGYMILSFIALWASARFAEFAMQFLALSIILGLKWVFDSKKQIIQIFMQDERG